MKKVWGFFWTLMALLGGYTLYSTWHLPSEEKNTILLGMSKNKLLFCVGILVFIIGCIFSAIKAFRNQQNIFSSGKAAGIAAWIILFALILGKIFLTPPVGKTALERSLLERLTPLAYWGLAFTAIALVLLLIQKFKELWHDQTQSIAALIWGAVIFLIIASCLKYALSTGTGIDPISGTFYRQGVSLLEGQLVIPLLCLYLLLPLFIRIGIDHSQSGKWHLGVLLLAAVVWGITFFVWKEAPFEGRSYFAPALRLPNNNFYPASDAENYDLLAQSILLGNGFRNGLTVVRPLYAAFLAFLHFLFGNDYMRLTDAQIFVLALIPVLIFLTGYHLHHTAAGLIAAAWVVLREIYSIRLSHLVQVSNSRLLMSDLPTALLVLFLILRSVKWYHNESESKDALLCGGWIGTAMLLRTQCFVLIPVLWLVFICSTKKTSRKWASVFLSILGMLIVFAPWTVWNRIHPNTTVDESVSEGEYLNSLYRKATGETDTSLKLWQIITLHPAESVQAVSAHFLNNEISSLLVLPMRLVYPEEADQLLYDDTLFWYRENARETIEQNLPLIIAYLVIISFGVITAYRRNKFGGLIPLGVHVVYNLGNAFALTSGFRFILPVDWVFLFYFAFGCSAVLDFLLRLCMFRFNSGLSLVPETVPRSDENVTDTENEPVPAQKHGQGWAFSGMIVLLALIGSILPLCDSIIPQKFAFKSSEQIAAEWSAISDSSSLDPADYADEEIVYLEGRAFYPRFYPAGEGDSGGSSSAKRGMDINRLVWMFHDNRVHVLCCPLTDAQASSMAVTKLSDPMDVVVMGIQRDDYIEVLEMRRIGSD